MKVTIRNLLLSHPLLKVFAVFCGYCFWLLLATNQITTRTFKVPLLFYNLGKQERIVGPEHVEITIKGQRQALHEVEKYIPSIHLDAATTTEVDKELSLAHGDILLPNNVNLINYNPVTIKVHKEKLDVIHEK
ncbi:hypothetical protein A3F06_01715 [candidate division TM6 bacterium RIFCSPHIGHO2_12_FULL_36_22]|nr:MAG: hypothetical protein A3F06_01715 [candidate division TM6 bacterium RIFCSPHIGHO2_12_FULL_36_22]